jgi:hypothetical protein
MIQPTAGAVILTLALSSVTLVSVGTWTAAAQDSGSVASDMVATRLCSSDLSARCSTELGGRDRIRTCVKEHLKDLSQECQERLARLAAISTACTADIKQFCADDKPGHSRIEACLQSAIANLSDACKEALAQKVAGTW